MKKLLVLIASVISTILSIILWVWYASIPSFQSTDKEFKDFKNETFQSENLGASNVQK